MNSELQTQARINKLLQYDIEYSKIEDEYDGLARLAGTICESPIAIISFVDSDAVYFKSHIGTDLTHNDLQNSFCLEAIHSPNEILEVEDTLLDARFTTHPLVAHSPHLRSYIGCPIISPEGIALGTVCVLDEVPRKWNDEQKRSLEILSKQVVLLLESKKNIKELAQSKFNLKVEGSRFKNILEASNVGAWEWDVLSNETIYNERWASMLGYTLDELKPLTIETWERLVREEDMKNINEHLDKCFRKEIEFYHIECRMRHKNGSWRWILDRGKVVEWSDDGKPLKMFGTHTDVTEKKENELAVMELVNALRVSEKRYSDLFQMSPQPMFVFDTLTLQIVDVNEAGLKSYGYNREEFLNLTIKDIRPPEDVEQLENTLKESLKINQLWAPGVFRHYTKSKKIKLVEVHSAPILYNNRPAKIIMANDITEQIHRFKIIENQNKAFKEISWMQSHLTRAPLARILGLMELVDGLNITDKQLNEYHELLKLSAEQLDHIIKNVSNKLFELRDR